MKRLLNLIKKANSRACKSNGNSISIAERSRLCLVDNFNIDFNIIERLLNCKC